MELESALLAHRAYRAERPAQGSPLARSILRAVPLAAAVAFIVAAVLHRVHASIHAEHAASASLLARDAVLALPLALAAICLAAAAASRLAGSGEHSRTGSAIRAIAFSLAGSLLFTLAMVPGAEVHTRLFPGGQSDMGMGWLEHTAAESTTIFGATFVSLLVLSLVLASLRTGTPRRAWRGGLRAATGLAAAAGVVVAVNAGPFSAGPVQAGPVSHQADPGACLDGGAPVREYDVVAINVDIPLNRWGMHNQAGMMYVLEQDRRAVENWSLPLAANPGDDPAGNRRIRPRPLVLRANAGDCVVVHFRNELNDAQGEDLPASPRASMHVNGVTYDAQTSDGAAVGFNADTTVPNHDDPGTADVVENEITYVWRAPTREGMFVIRDTATPGGSEGDSGSLAVGLYGALVVEPAGSRYFDTYSGVELYTPAGHQLSGDLYVDAMVDPPGAAPAFRESVQLAQDEIPTTGEAVFGFNYGTEPQSQREANLCPDCISEETALSSWPYGDPSLVKLASGPGPWLPEDPGPDGDPATPEDCGLAGSCWTSNVFHAYAGDPTKIRFAMAGIKETHVFHLHAHQWLSDPENEDSQIIDSQTFGPGEAFTADILFGAGSAPGTFGDAIFHCHLYPHFAEGFWSLFRIHDVLENGRTDLFAGSGKTPDGIAVRPISKLPDRAALPLPTATNPGYPRFIPGEIGWRAPQPPKGVTQKDTNGDEVDAPRIVAGQALTPADTAVEQAVQQLHYGGQPVERGAPFRDPCPTGARELVYDVSVMQMDIVYNEAGWHDTQGRVLVLSKDVEAVRSGEKPAEPLFIRANKGDCITFKLTNLLPNFFGHDAFVELLQTNMAGEHIHLVKFDVLGSDGASNGWNYQEAAFTEDQTAFNDALLDGNPGNDPLCDASECRVPMPDDWDPQYDGLHSGQTIYERWYADEELRTVFTHDHHFPAIDQNRGLYGALLVEPEESDFRDPYTGEFFQPISDPAHGPVCGKSCEATAAGTRMDVIGPYANDDFREFGLSIQDFVALTKRGGDPQDPNDVFAPPPTPEHFPNDDPGVMAMNYRNAPFLLRDTKNGQPVDPAYVFSSHVFGDPQTPVFEAYTGDPLRIRLIQGSQEEQHFVAVHGMRWRSEPTDPKSDFVAGKTIGVSEAFNFEVPGFDCKGIGDPCRGDYLYSGQGTDDLWLGAWGILRIRGFRDEKTILPLPDNPRSFHPSLLALGQVTQATSAVSGGGSLPQQITGAFRWINKTQALVDGSPRFAAASASLERAETTLGEAKKATSTGNKSLAKKRLHVAKAHLLKARAAIQRARKALLVSLPSAKPAVVPKPVKKKRKPSGTTTNTSGNNLLAPPKPLWTGLPCPALTLAKPRLYEIVAFGLDIPYNGYGDHDPHGLMFALAEDYEDIVAGRKAPEPLVIRANEGDCIMVKLRNELKPGDVHRSGTDGDPELVLEPDAGTRTGLRVSLHPQLVDYDIRGSDGTAVGFNGDQTAGPGQSVTYMWYAPDTSPGELGAANLLDFGDIRGHRHHGLFAGLVIEPKGSTWHDPITGKEIRSGSVADIRVPGRPDFREYALFFQDGLNLSDESGEPIPDPVGHPVHPPEPGAPPEPAEGPELLDAEDQGEKGFNYRSEPFYRRLGYDPGLASGEALADDWARVFSSIAHGDPATPIFRAYTGDGIRIRIFQGGDKPRQHAFVQSAGAFLEEPGDPKSQLIDTIGGITVGKVFNAELPVWQNPAGDYRYYCAVGFHHQQGGLWGITRIYRRPAAQDATLPSEIATQDDPRDENAHPVLPLEVDRALVTLVWDKNRNGRVDLFDPAVPAPASWAVAASRNGEPRALGVLQQGSTFALSVLPGAYRVDITAPDGWATASSRPINVTTRGNNSTVRVTVLVRKTAP